MKFYTGIGSRTPPQTIYSLMVEYGIRLGKLGYSLRSGAADGCDSAFENGAVVFPPNPVENEIYLPWKGFNKDSDQRKYLKNSKLYLKNMPKDIVEKAKEIAAQFHEKFQFLPYASKCLHTRNVFQVLGKDLNTPSEFVICWTPDGNASGGTGQAMRIAFARKIPIFNLFHTVDKLALDRKIEMLENNARGA